MKGRNGEYFTSRARGNLGPWPNWTSARERACDAFFPLRARKQEERERAVFKGGPVKNNELGYMRGAKVIIRDRERGLVNRGGEKGGRKRARVKREGTREREVLECQDATWPSLGSARKRGACFPAARARASKSLFPFLYPRAAQPCRNCLLFLFLSVFFSFTQIYIYVIRANLWKAQRHSNVHWFTPALRVGWSF